MPEFCGASSSARLPVFFSGTFAGGWLRMRPLAGFAAAGQTGDSTGHRVARPRSSERFLWQPTASANPNCPEKTRSESVNPAGMPGLRDHESIPALASMNCRNRHPVGFIAPWTIERRRNKAGNDSRPMPGGGSLSRARWNRWDVSGIGAGCRMQAGGYSRPSLRSRFRYQRQNAYIPR